MEKIIIGKEELEKIAVKRGFKLPHNEVTAALRTGDYFGLMTNEELERTTTRRKLRKQYGEDWEIASNNEYAQILRGEL